MQSQNHIFCAFMSNVKYKFRNSPPSVQKCSVQIDTCLFSTICVLHCNHEYYFLLCCHFLAFQTQLIIIIIEEKNKNVNQITACNVKRVIRCDYSTENYLNVFLSPMFKRKKNSVCRTFVVHNISVNTRM